MGHTDSFPQARVVRAAGQQYAPPAPPASSREPSMLLEQMKSAAAVAIGLWPLTAVVVLLIGLFVLVNLYSSP